MLLEYIEGLLIEIVLALHNPKNHDSHLIMQPLGKFNFKINVIPNGLEKNTSLNNKSKLRFIEIFQLLSFSLDS